MCTNTIITSNTSFAITHPFAVMAIFTMAHEFSVDTACSKLRFYKLTTIHEILTTHTLVTILAITTIIALIITSVHLMQVTKKK